MDPVVGYNPVVKEFYTNECDVRWNYAGKASDKALDVPSKPFEATRESKWRKDNAYSYMIMAKSIGGKRQLATRIKFKVPLRIGYGEADVPCYIEYTCKYNNVVYKMTSEVVTAHLTTETKQFDFIVKAPDAVANGDCTKITNWSAKLIIQPHTVQSSSAHVYVKCTQAETQSYQIIFTVICDLATKIYYKKDASTWVECIPYVRTDGRFWSWFCVFRMEDNQWIPCVY